MNTKGFVVILVVCIAFVLCGLLCISMFRDSSNVIEDPVRGIVLEVKKDTVSNVGLTLVMKNVASNNYAYGSPYWVERKIDDHWERVLSINGYGDVWTSELIFLRGNSVTELEIEWEWWLGALSAGDYRIAKSFAYLYPSGGNGEYYPISAEFRIELSGIFTGM
ncbi:MAG: hypothetical protein LBB87_04075 [Nitrososphaerota archaeon]|jgi:hypothetical protein|nr:hypothetical protein [Nitrososphaerota archaeon]